MKDIFKKKHKTIKVKYLPKEWTLGYRPPQRENWDGGNFPDTIRDEKVIYEQNYS